MTAEAQQIIGILSEYLMKHPTARFTQALHNLSINQFNYTHGNAPQLRDPYNDHDPDVLKRVEKAMTEVRIFDKKQ